MLLVVQDSYGKCWLNTCIFFFFAFILINLLIFIIVLMLLVVTVQYSLMLYRQASLKQVDSFMLFVTIWNISTINITTFFGRQSWVREDPCAQIKSQSYRCNVVVWHSLLNRQASFFHRLPQTERVPCPSSADTVDHTFMYSSLNLPNFCRPLWLRKRCSILKTACQRLKNYNLNRSGH